MSVAETLELLSIISYVVAGISLVLAVFFWIFFKISTVIGDLSGRTARKSIARMRAANENSGSKSYKASKTNAERGKLTAAIKASEKLKKRASVTETDRPDTGLLNENTAEVTLSEETGMLESETTGLLVEEEATAPLEVPGKRKERPEGGKKLNMIDDIMLIHTDEVI